ncbi:sigma-70 family RNA polymerase sigma factor [Chitinophaga agrisoli]|uniref:Sigma-70 family RNA polymerase sigma factor n=1 Tax=Chitinophaga agrisoli TaxID=2607653 RepID=A0A5B2VH87_9BACT|nr:sigma-70 family RNA polymerase sigma factor [Chitinophaga agrisoli]KAA2238943.1 sigma-70 family RNA polymerase sigma factor [Chitinophaga agrisoli]
MPDHLDNEKVLFQLIAEGSQEAFAAVYARYHEKIYSLSFHLTKSEVVAEEIVQDVFLKVWLQKQGLPEIRNFESWLFILARNHIYTWLKARAQRVTLEPLPEDFVSVEPVAAESVIHRKEFEALINAAVQQLPPQQQQVYNLSREEHLGREAIAERLGVSPETVKVHLSRAMRSIRAYLTARMPISLIFLLILNFLLIFLLAM